MKNRSSLALFLAAAAALPTHAAPLSWDPSLTPLSPSGGAGTWDLSNARWSNGAADVVWTDSSGTLDTANFGGAAGTVTLGTNLSARGIAFTTAGYTLTASTLSLGISGINASALASGTTTINSALSLTTGSQTWSTGPGSTLAINGAVSRSNGAVLSLAAGGAYTSSSLANTHGILGTWASTGTGASTRYVTVNAGTLIGYTAATVMATTGNAWGGIPSGGTGTVNYEISIAGTPSVTGLVRNVNSILYTGSGMTQGGNNTGLLLNTNGILNAGTGTLAIGASVNQYGIAASSTTSNQMALSAANAGITINADIRNNLTSASSVVTSGPNTVTLAGNNSFTGDLIINSGTLVASRTNNVNNAVTSSLGNPQVARNVVANPGSTLRLTGGDVLGSATTTPLSTLVVNQGAIVTNNGNNFNSLGPLVMNGGQLTTSGGPVVGYQSYNLTGSVTVGGSGPSSISIDGPGNAFNGVHLNTNTLFTVADATANSESDLLVSTPLINRNNSLPGPGGFTKAGPGTMTLATTNAYTGPTTITSGTLQIGDGLADGSIATSSGITNNADLVFQIGETHSYPNPLTGSGNLTVKGGGWLSLTSAANNYAGTTSLTDGALLLKGGFGAISVAANPYNLLGHEAGGAFSASSLAFAGEASVDFKLTGGPAPIMVAGTLSTTPANGKVALEINSLALSNGVHNLISFGSFAGNISDFTTNFISGLNSRQSASVILNGSNLAINVSGDTPKWTGLDNSSWTLGSTGPSSNWRLANGGTATHFEQNDDVLFDDTATGTTTININGGDVSPRIITFNNSSLNYTLTSAANGILTGAMFKSGTGALTIDSANLFADGLTFSGGTLHVNSSTAIGTGLFRIEPGSAKTIDNTSGSPVANTHNNLQEWLDDFSFTGSNHLDLGTGTVTIAGDNTDRVVTINTGTLTVGEIKAASHGLIKQGAGTLVVTSTGGGGAASTLAGTLGVTAGTLQINRSGTDAGGSGDLTATGITGNGTITNGADVERWLFINTPDNHTFSGTLANGGPGGLGFNKQGTGTVTLAGDNSHTGLTTVEAGTLVMAHPSAFGIGSTVRMAGINVATLDIATDGGNNLYGFVFATGVNSTILSNRATEGEGLNHSLTTLGANGLGGGILTVASGINVTSGRGRITFNNFDLSSGAAAQTTLVNPTTANVTLGHVSKVTNVTAQILGLGGTSEDNAVTGLIADGTAVVALAKSNSSTWTVSGENNTYTGNTNIGAANGAGVLRATASAALGTGTIMFDGSGGNPGPTSRLELSNGITLGNAINLHQRNNSSAIILNTGGTNTLGGNINLTTGGTRGNIESEAGVLTLSGTVSTTTATTRNLHLGGAGNGAATGPIVDNPANAAGIVAVHKNGAGTWTLSGANTYTGTTTVNAGILSLTLPSLPDAAAVSIASDAELNLTHGGNDIVDRLFIGGLEQSPGTWGSLASSATNKTARITGSGILSVTNGISGYSSWASLLGLTPGVNDTSTTDAELDGFDNGTEFMLGGNPLNGSNNPKIHSFIADTNADADALPELVMTIAVPVGTPAFSAGAPQTSATFSGYVVSVRGSSDLAAFAVAVTPVDPVTTGLPAAPVQGGITYEYRSFSLGGSNGTPGKGFLQVSVTHP
jgi:autotransporter-associated beta strand protein